MSDTYSDGLKKSPVGAVYETFHDRRSSPAPVNDFPPLSDEEYGQMEDEYNARQQQGDAIAKRVGDMKRQAHKPPPKPPDPVAQAMKNVRKMHGLARKARGRRR